MHPLHFQFMPPLLHFRLSPVTFASRHTSDTPGLEGTDAALTAHLIRDPTLGSSYTIGAISQPFAAIMLYLFILSSVARAGIFRAFLTIKHYNSDDKMTAIAAVINPPGVDRTLFSHFGTLDHTTAEDISSSPALDGAALTMCFSSVFPAVWGVKFRPVSSRSRSRLYGLAGASILHFGASVTNPFLSFLQYCDEFQRFCWALVHQVYLQRGTAPLSLLIPTHI